MISNQAFMPHGHCYLWMPSLVWTMVVTDTLIFLAYTTISISLYRFVKKIKVPFHSMILAFGVFIAACGLTHLMEVYTLWNPAYWESAFIKVITAVASVATAVWLFPLMPKIVAVTEAARLSEKRKLQLEDLTRQLQQQALDLKTTNNELEAFCYSVSHDLRAPLRSMMGYASETLRSFENQLDPQAVSDLKKVVSSAQRMGGLIDGLLSLSKLTRTDIKNEPVLLSEMAHQIVRDLKDQDPNREVDVVIEDNIKVPGDSRLLQIALNNLIHNAWKFTSKNVRKARIEFGHELQQKRNVYYVRDNGAGFNMSYSNKLFEPFQRLHSEKEFAGNGIGLASVQRIIHKHGGKIWVDSTEGLGTTFYFTIKD